MYLATPKSINLQFSQIQYPEAAPFIEKWHYSGCVPKGKNLFFAWTLDSLYAVANYGWGVNPYQASYLARTTGLDIKPDNLLELKRLCRAEPRIDGVYLTQFLARCHRQLKSQGFKYIVCFSDPEYGHNGGIYKAANFTHMGQTNPEMHCIDRDGHKVHRRLAYRHSRRHGIPIAESRQILGLKTVKTLPKDRWFLIIN